MTVLLWLASLVMVVWAFGGIISLGLVADFDHRPRFPAAPWVLMVGGVALNGWVVFS